MELPRLSLFAFAACIFTACVGDTIAGFERLSFANAEGWEEGGSIVRFVGHVAGESTVAVDCAGVQRIFEISVR